MADFIECSPRTGDEQSKSCLYRLANRCSSSTWAVRHTMHLKSQPHLIIDIGGGSVEFIVGDEARPSTGEPQVGAARMAGQFVKSDPISEDDHRAC